ncbi:very short patch repair endonuclease [Alicyclobacillus fastidiosus]|uniref:Very short patch repair endonuclease n=1 Tax=Alicyclobacillus fastidiosus TaxID=392011 RepID=A0ABV5AHJ0_9BACL|nr:very short patch repair endonuclease [Alicyclobacillus fastidiosus]WEH09179.1 very short patch repair endonuclease [Alicyclobacillus fastidiosus]
MADIVSPDDRSRMMGGIKNKNTKPELLIRSGLHKLGFRYHVNYLKLPGQPDLVLPRYRAVIFVHGCFWHRHDCHLFRWPSTREEFWKRKILANVERDKKTVGTLIASGWRVLIVWECAIKGKTRRPVGEVLDECATWLKSQIQYDEIRGMGSSGTSE